MTNLRSRFSTIVERYRTLVHGVTLHVRSRRLLRRLGYPDVQTLLKTGTVEHIASYTLAGADVICADDPQQRGPVVHQMLPHLLESRRGSVLPLDVGTELRQRAFVVQVVLAMLDQGLLPFLLMRSPRSSMVWLWCEPTIYRRLIDGMTVEDLNTGVVESHGKGVMAWFVFLEATAYGVERAQRSTVMLDQVTRLRDKGIDVSVERIEDLLNTVWARVYGGARDVLPVLRDVDAERRRQERAALTEVADQARAEAPEPAPRRARARL